MPRRMWSARILKTDCIGKWRKDGTEHSTQLELTCQRGNKAAQGTKNLPTSLSYYSGGESTDGLAFEQQKEDIQLSSAIKILDVLD